MRIELSFDVDDQGVVHAIGWKARDEQFELLALGCRLGKNVTYAGPHDALADALIFCLEDVASNGGHQAELPF